MQQQPRENVPMVPPRESREVERQPRPLLGWQRPAAPAMRLLHALRRERRRLEALMSHPAPSVSLAAGRAWAAGAAMAVELQEVLRALDACADLDRALATLATLEGEAGR